MARAPFQVLVLPFRISEFGEYEFAIFRREDAGYWQGVAGGGEVGETIQEAALREMNEEANIPISVPFYQLKTMTYMPVYFFKAREQWPQDQYVIPGYCFAADASGISIELSHEHTEYKWVSYDDAAKMLYWSNNKTALWELKERLRNGDLQQVRCRD